MQLTTSNSAAAGTSGTVAVRRRPCGLPAGLETALLIGVFMLLATFYTGGSGVLKTAGKGAVIAVLLLVFYTGVPYLVRRGALDARLAPALRWFGALIALPALWMLVHNASQRGLIVTGQLALYLVFFTVLCGLRWSPLATAVLSWPFTLFFLGTGLWWLAAGVPLYFRGLMLNPNTLGAVAGFTLFFPLLALQAAHRPVQRYLWWLVTALGLGLILASGARSVWLALCAAALCWYAWPWLTRTSRRYSAAIGGLLAFVLVFTLVYALVSLLLPVAELNRLTGGVTGEGLFSGREILWLALLQAILHNPLLGYGPAAAAADFLPTELSAHNTYITVALQQGLIGLGCYLALLFSVWRLYWPGRADPRVRLAAAFFVAVLLHQVFELVFIQDKLAFNLTQWLIVGIGAGISLNRNAVNSDQ